MGSPERVKGHVKRDTEDSSGGRDDESWEADERRKRRSGKSKQSGSGEENEGVENTGRKEKSESRKRQTGASKAVSEEDDYESRKESRSKQMKKKHEESALESLSSWYQDGDGEKRHDGGERSERRKSTSKLSTRESSQSKSKVKDERVHDVELQEKDSRKEGRNPRKRWDDANNANKIDESNNLKHHERDEKRSEIDKNKNNGSPTNHGDVPAERSYNADEDGGTRTRDRGKKDIDRDRDRDRSTRSRTPERSTRRHHESEYSEMDSDKSGSYRRKNLETDSYRDERSRGRDDSWKRRQETKDGDAPYDYTRDWESPSQRRGRDRDRVEPERNMGRVSGRKDGNRTYDVIEIETKSYDVNEQSDIKPVPNDDDQSVEDSKDRYGDDRNMEDVDGGKSKGQRGNFPNRPGGGWQGQSSSNNRMGRGGRVRPTGRDGQQVNMQVPMMGSPFGPLAMPPPGGMQPLTPTMSPGPGGPPMSPAVFIPPFSPPVVWPGVPPGLTGVVPPGGPSGPIFPPNIATPQNPAMFFNQPGPVRGMPPNILGPGFNPLGPMGRGQQPDPKGPGGWVPPRNNGPPGKAPSRGEQNDYSQNFVDTGMRPQNFIRELELTSVVEDYPKLRELIQKKDEIVANSASAPMYYKCDLREQVLSPEFFGTKFDVILVDPPWEEYVHRAPGVTDHMDYWTFEEIMNLKIEAIADTPCFVFLWVGDGVGLEQGRQCLKKWGFRRCEDICWVKTNKTNATPGLRHDSHTLFQRSKEHCLMGIKGTVRRSTDGHIIHANIDTDVIIAEEPPYGSTAKPEDMYRIIEHFSLGRRRLELFGEDHNIRAGWLTVGKDLSSSNFNAEAYIRNFADKDGKVWQGGGGRNPPPETGHLVLTTPDIEALRPKSPMKNQLQMQQQAQQSNNTISLTPGGGGNKRPGSNDPLIHNGPGMNQEGSSSNISGLWGPPMGGVMGGPNEGFFDNMYGYNGPFGPMGGEFMDFETQRAMNNMM
ncbi:N6-adenosine-methyltransferase non-catalytic subunit MTB-like [Bidens hawaiensis]|uniref:N6-adenosine-methyltransferase non-catalytic subunit MTB-like n=1 Tax=Bidens hawaiensis TaxID=980011 RepID=UPI004049EDE8